MDILCHFDRFGTSAHIHVWPRYFSGNSRDIQRVTARWFKSENPPHYVFPVNIMPATPSALILRSVADLMRYRVVQNVVEMFLRFDSKTKVDLHPLFFDLIDASTRALPVSAKGYLDVVAMRTGILDALIELVLE